MFTPEPATQQWLAEFLRANHGIAGTVHRNEGGTLHLVAAVNIPPKVIEITQVIPEGKGMAGLALQRRQPVQTCNLQTDKTGDVRPGARAVNAQAAVALPVTNAKGEIRAIAGIAFDHEEELSSALIEQLSAAAATLPAAS